MAINIRRLGLKDYLQTWQAMQAFTAERQTEANDEIWIVEHPPVYTLGLNGKRKHIISATNIPVVETDRGGQVTYHGPGQLVVYTLLDIKRLKLGVRSLVSLLEQAMLDTLSQYGIRASARRDAPGVYIQGKKIGSVGLRIKKGCSYHGLSFNNHMDLSPFNYINPCGHPDLKVTQVYDQGIDVQTDELAIPVTHSIYTALQQAYE